jgi:hypothetical protein
MGIGNWAKVAYHLGQSPGLEAATRPRPGDGGRASSTNPYITFAYLLYCCCVFKKRDQFILFSVLAICLLTPLSNNFYVFILDNWELSNI